MLQVPGSVSVGCLVIGFAMLSIVTLCRLPQLWREAGAVPREQALEAATHGA
jgi:hypothetical protein